MNEFEKIEDNLFFERGELMPVANGRHFRFRDQYKNE